MRISTPLLILAICLSAASAYGADASKYNSKSPAKKIVLLKRPYRGMSLSTPIIGRARPVARYDRVLLKDIDLNRRARKLSKFRRRNLHNSHTGFMWNKGDNNTAKWRPQGITGMTAGGKKFLAVSWYGRSQKSYENRGARISFADVTSMDSIKYRHVLLVDENYETFEETHAGGLAYENGKLYVADTSHSRKDINVFAINSIEEIPQEDLPEFYNYRYVLRRESSYAVSVTPSFLSFDYSSKQFLTGTFNEDDEDVLQWYSGLKNNVKTCGPFFKKMQGAAYQDGILWVASSYGRTSKSKLHAGRYKQGQTVDSSQFKTRKYPPGLEDLHISKSGNIWMLTEFRPGENPASDRIVFATKKHLLMP